MIRRKIHKCFSNFSTISPETTQLVRQFQKNFFTLQRIQMFLKEGLGDERGNVNNFGKMARFSHYKRIYLHTSNKYARTIFF